MKFNSLLWKTIRMVEDVALVQVYVSGHLEK
jgi:hypothetical protein